MTEAQSIFFTDLVNGLRDEGWQKSTAGIEEHGGTNIWDIPVLTLLKEAKNEFIDGYVYTQTAIGILEILLADPIIKARVTELLEGKHV